MIETLRGCLELLRLSWRESRVKLLVAVVLKLAEAAALPMAAATLGLLTDAAVAGDTGRASLAGAVAAGLVITQLTVGHFAHIAYFELGEANFLTKDQQLVELANGSAGIEHHERPEYADKMEVLNQELRRVSWSSMDALLSGVSLGGAITLTAVLLASRNPWLLLLPLAAVPALVTGRRAEALLGRAREASAERSRLAWHLFSLAVDAGPAKELRVAGLEQRIRDRHAVLWRSVSRTLGRAETRAALLRIAGQLVFAAGYVAATLLVVRDAVAGRHSVGDVVLVISLAALINQQVSAAVTLLQELHRVARALADFRWLRHLVALREPAPATAPVPERIHHGLRLRHVGFDYPGTGRTALDGVDVLLPAGTTVGLVGKNGAGKTTLVKLLCRLYEPSRGTIELDGVNVADLPLDGWRARIAAGFQDFVRFELPARQVVGVGDLPLVDDTAAVTVALDRAQATDVVEGLARGLDTPLGTSLPDGALPSGGQWQKLALGRAMMRGTPLLLVLDEPTAALDALAEHALFTQYAAGTQRVAAHTGAITVLVSHRFSTVRMADLILVLVGGRVVEAGNHDQLVAAGGLYAELYAIQAAAYR